MSNPWNDINLPGFSKGKKDVEPKKKFITGVDDSCGKEEMPEPEVRLLSAEWKPGPKGFQHNEQCFLDVKAEYLKKTIRARIRGRLFAKYNGEEFDLAQEIEGFIDTDSSIARMNIKNLWFVNLDHYKEWLKDKSVATQYIIKDIAHSRGANEIDSPKLDMPASDEYQFVPLKKGDYDKNVATKYNKPQTGDNFKPNDVVKTMQGNLVKTGFLPQGSDDGFFGDDTEKSLNVFQDYAIKENRMKRKVGKIETTDKKLEQAQPDGVYGKKTHDELTCWVQNDWIKPILTLRHGEFDQNGVNDIDRKPETDNFHSGNPVLDAQKSLQSVDAYKGFAMDGWFHDKMKDAVALFQQWAEKGQLLINGTTTDIGEKLTGYQKGILCPKTQEILKKAVEKGGKVSNEADYYSLNVQFSSSLELDRQKILSKKSINILGKAAFSVNIKHITMTSTIRYPHQQADAMYTNLSNGKRLSYAAPGMAVTEVYDECQKLKLDKSKTIQKMTDKIDLLSQLGKRVSKHCVSIEEYNKLNIVDIAIPSENTKEFIFELAKDKDVERIYHDIKSIIDSGKIARLAKEPCIHVEIKQ